MDDVSGASWSLGDHLDRIGQGMSSIGRGLAVGGIFVGAGLNKVVRLADTDIYRHAGQIPFMSYRYLHRPPTEAVAIEDDGSPPVIFTHGLGGHPGDFLPIHKYFRYRGRKRLFTVPLPGHLPLERQAEALDRFIEDVCQVNGVERVDVVAHSMGGIVARLALHDGPAGPRIRRLVNLAVPNFGTHPARFASSPNVRALRVDSPLLKRLNSLELPGSVEVFSLWSKNDLLILPWDSAHLPGSTHIEMTPFTHYSYFLEYKSWATIFELLATR